MPTLKLFVVAREAKWNIDGAAFISKFAAELQFDALIAFEDEAIRMAGSTIMDTPLWFLHDKHSGTLRNNWQIGRKPNSRILGANKRKSGKYAQSKIRGKFATVNKKGIKRESNKSLFFFNNAPYARVVEFGGYPSPVKNGSWNTKTKQYEKRSRSGYSKQAPRGMLRRNINSMRNRLRKRISGL